MNQKQAIAILSKALGKDFGYRVDPKALDAAARAEAREQAAALRVKRDEARKARDAREAKLLAEDAEYQRLAADAALLSKAHDEQASRSFGKRITVGINSKLWFSVKADGDNWQEVVDAVTKKGA